MCVDMLASTSSGVQLSTTQVHLSPARRPSTRNGMRMSSRSAGLR